MYFDGYWSTDNYYELGCNVNWLNTSEAVMCVENQESSNSEAIFLHNPYPQSQLAYGYIINLYKC